MSKALKKFLLEKIAGSPHSALLVNPPPPVAGGGDTILAAIGPEDNKVIYLGVRHGGDTVRVGFAAKDRWANEEIEDAVESNGGTMTEFLEDEMEADDELQYEVQHFHDSGWFHFASDIGKDAAWFETGEGRDLVWFYFDGYARAILPHLEGEED